MPTETVDAVRAHLDAITASPGFVNASRMSRFLRYTVEMKLRGEGEQIKEFLVGRDVFDRGSDYDPRLDPIVRVEARRLRQCLAKYYEGPGRSEAIRIDFPKGSYVPVIQPAAIAGPVDRKWQTGRPWLWRLGWAGLAAALALVLLKHLTTPSPAGKTVAVVPARWVWNNTGELETSDEALAEAITAQLANQGRRVVIGWPVVARYRESRDVRALGRQLGAELIWVVAVRKYPGDRDRVTVFQLNAITGAKMAVADHELPDNLDTLAATIARTTN